MFQSMQFFLIKKAYNKKEQKLALLQDVHFVFQTSLHRHVLKYFFFTIAKQCKKKNLTCKLVNLFPQLLEELQPVRYICSVQKGVGKLYLST